MVRSARRDNGLLNRGSEAEWRFTFVLKWIRHIMAKDLGKRYFNAIQNAWSPFAKTHRIIPFCTPLMSSASAVVIGTNHSDFVDGGGETSERIADALASKVPKDNTFLVHNHKFAHGLREVCNRADIRIDKTWIGTNRCAVQTGPGGIAEIKKDPHFSDCQKMMDRILLDLLAEIMPQNVILVGKHAIGLYYASAAAASIVSLKPHDIPFPGADAQIRVIPIPHPSRAVFWQPAADALSKHFIRRPEP